LLFTVIPGIGYLITAGVVRLLKVDRQFMRQIQSDLETRRINREQPMALHDVGSLSIKHP
jgi:Na+/melibiose symporter-like transporter